MNKEEKEARYLINVLEDKKFTAQGEALRTYIEELNKNIDKLQKELQYEKNEIMNLAGMLDEKDEEIKSLEIDLEIGNNMCGKLQEENEKLKELLGE